MQKRDDHGKDGVTEPVAKKPVQICFVEKHPPNTHTHTHSLTHIHTHSLSHTHTPNPTHTHTHTQNQQDKELRLTFHEALQVGKVGGSHNFTPRLLPQPLWRWVRVWVLQGHPASQKEPPHLLIYPAPVADTER